MTLAPRLNLKWLLILVLGAAGGMGVMRLISWKTSDAARMARVARRDLAPVPPGFFDVAPLATKDESGPAVIQPGQILIVELLEALPGRPITGERMVRPDGTISLGFYGDLHVAGLNRNQLKVKVIEHLRKYLHDEVLGLVKEYRDGSPVAILPVESDRIFVDEYVDYEGAAAKRRRVDNEALGGRIDALDAKLDRVLKELEQARQGPRPAEAATPDPTKPL